MVHSYGLLTGNAVVDKLPLITACVCGVILLIAFFVGLKKGFRRVSWGGLFWLIAGVAFVLTDRFLLDKLSLDKLFDGFVKADYVPFACSATLAICCIVVTLVVQLVLGAFLRPKVKFVKRKTRVSYDGYGFEYEEDGDNFDDEYYADDYYGKKPKKIGYGKPRAFTRITGGLTCMLNTAIVLAIVLAFALFIVSGTKLSQGALEGIFEKKVVGNLLSYAKTYVLDFITIGIIFAMAYQGYKKGFADTIRSFLLPLCGFAAVVACCVLPFLKYSEGEWAFLTQYVERCVRLFNKAKYAKLFGRILAAVLGAIVAALLFALLGFLFGKLDKGIKSVKPLRAIDGVLSCVLFLAIGAAICFAIWTVFYLLEYCGIFYASQLFDGKASLANGFYEAAETFAKGFADKYLLKYA